MPTPIAEPGDVTPQWLNAVLSRNFPGRNRHVSAVSVVSTRTLQFSRIARLRVEYSDASFGQLPSHLFLKLSLANTSGVTPAESGSEVMFYRSVAPEMRESPLISCYDAEFSVDSGGSHLLLEDLSDSHFQTKPNEHPSFESSEAAVECLARFHAHWWGHPKLGKGIGRMFDQDWLDSFLTHLEISVTDFVESLRDQLTNEQRNAYDRLLRCSRRIWGRLTDSAGLTVAHGDTHWWNFLYPNGPSADHTRIFDWQLWHIDLGARDLAFLIALGGFAERRPELETHLLRKYHEALISSGVKDYSWSKFWTDYRWSAIRNLNIPVIFRSQGKHPSTWKKALDRAFQSFNELKCKELLTIHA